MLFLLRPQQTWMPYYLPRDPVQQGVRNEQMRTAYDATRRVPPNQPAADTESPDVIGQLKTLAELHHSGALTDEEFTAAKAKLLSEPEQP
jgi:Short C-terminal domain